MSQTSKLLSVDAVVVDCDATSKKRVFEQAGLLFENRYGISRSAVYDALFAREKMGSTGLGLGVAIPHGRAKDLQQAHGAFFRLATPVQFDAPDGLPVRLVFVLLVPEAATEHHLELLSELAQMFSEAGFRDSLNAAPDAAAAHALFAQWQSTS